MAVERVLPSEVTELLDEGFIGYLGTSGWDRIPHVTPVIFVYDGESIFFTTSKLAKKLRNIQENSRVAFLVDVRDPSDLYKNRAVMIYGRAKIIHLFAHRAHPHLIRVLTLFLKKYPEYTKAYAKTQYKIPKVWKPIPFIRRLIVQIAIERFVYMRETQVVKVTQQT